MTILAGVHIFEITVHTGAYIFEMAVHTGMHMFEMTVHTGMHSFEMTVHSGYRSLRWQYIQDCLSLFAWFYKLLERNYSIVTSDEYKL